jgi:hypothetical protein
VERLVFILRDIAHQTGLQSLVEIARQPGMKAVYRIIVRYADRQTHNSVATLRHVILETPVLEVVYQGLFDHKPLTHTIDLQRFEAFMSVLQNTRFDRLPDQPNLPFYGVELWLVERAVGGFYKSVILSPNQQDVPYTSIVNAVDAYLPEAVRKVAQ